MTLASYITLLRIVFIIPIMYLTSEISLQANIFALFLFFLAGITDYLDGKIARKTNTETSLGALLDLLADKLLVCIVLVWLVFVKHDLFLIIPVLIIISRELIISSLRQYIVESVGENKIKVSKAGKSKTGLQFLAISLLIISPNLGHYFNLLSYLVIWLAAFMSAYSMILYLRDWRVYF